MSMKDVAELRRLVEQWLATDRNAETRCQIETMWASGQTAQLRRLLATRLSFGTAGLRAVMEAGYARMNHLTVLLAAQGLGHYLTKHAPAAELCRRGVVIGFDGRHHSRTFARLTAAVMRELGIASYLFDTCTPTPFVPFAIRRYGHLAGVMVTASHNPKQYNGYKVYWANGAQITTPHDMGIAREMNALPAPPPAAWAGYDGDHCPTARVVRDYFDSLAEDYVPAASATTTGSRSGDAASVIFTYTAMHGVGAPYVLRALRQVGVGPTEVVVVRAQEQPDAEFPTVASPNPEEGLTALRLAVETAERAGSTVVLASDPDADRLGVAERQLADGTWRFFTGNELAALLGWWAVQYMRRHVGAAGAPADLHHCYFLSSVVSSPILANIARAEGMSFGETLIGFKWMGAYAERLVRDGASKVLLAFEESIGFMWGTRVLDKDAVTAAAVVADMTRYLYQHGRRLCEQLAAIYSTYGYHHSHNSYVTYSDPESVRRLVQDIRTSCHGGYPRTIAGARVVAVRDLGRGIDTRMDDGKARLPCSATNPLITFFLDNGVTLSIRASGTEPKLKWYTDLVTHGATQDGEALLTHFVERFVCEVVQPDKYGFSRRASHL